MSWVLTESLEASGVAGKPRECLQPMQINAWLDNHPRKTTADYLRHCLDESKTPNEVSCVRVHWKAWRELPGRLGISSLVALHSYLGKPKYVLTTRRDKDAQAVSMVKAYQTGRFFKIKDKPDPPEKAPAKFDAARIEAAVKNLGEQEANWRAFFTEIKATPVEYVFEDALIAGNDAACKAVLAGLGIDTVGITIPESKFLPASDDVNSDWLTKLAAERKKPKK